MFYVLCDWLYQPFTIYNKCYSAPSHWTICLIPTAEDILVLPSVWPYKIIIITSGQLVLTGIVFYLVLYSLLMAAFLTELLVTCTCFAVDHSQGVGSRNISKKERMKIWFWWTVPSVHCSFKILLPPKAQVSSWQHSLQWFRYKEFTSACLQSGVLLRW